MRCLVLFSTIALAGVAAWSAAAADGERVACGARSIDVFFWPRGHGSLRSVGFPMFPQPHVEVFRAGDVSDRTGFFAFASATETSLGRSCSKVRNVRREVRWAGGTVVRTTGARRIRCTFGRRVELVLAEVITRRGAVAGFRLDVTLGHTARAVVSARVNSRAPHELRYAKRACRRLPLPA